MKRSGRRSAGRRPARGLRTRAALLLFACLGYPGIALAGAGEIAFLAGSATNTKFGRLVPLFSTAELPTLNIVFEPRDPLWTLSLAYPLGRRIELQATASLVNGAIIYDANSDMTGDPQRKMKIAEAAKWSFGGSLLYRFGRSRVSPYLAVGGGATALKIEGAGRRARPFVEFGVGLKTRLSRRFQLVLDIRREISFFRFFEDFRLAYILNYRFDSRNLQMGWKASLGLAFRL